MRGPRLTAVGLLMAGLMLAPGCGRKSGPSPVGPPPEVIGPGATLLRMPHTRGFLSFEVSVAASPDGRTVAAGRLVVPPDDSAFSGAVVSLCDVVGRRERATIRGDFGEGSGVAFSPDGKTLAVGRSHDVMLYDADTCRERAALASDSLFGALALSFSADGRRLAAATGLGMVVVWDVGAGRGVAVMKAHTRSLQGVALSPDGLSVASASDGPIVCRPFGPFGLPARIFGVAGVGCGPDRGVVRLFDVETGREKANLEHDWTAHSVAFSPDGRALASGGGGAAKLWDLSSMQARTIVEAGAALDVYAVAFSPDGRTLAIAVGSRDFRGDFGEVRLWDMSLRRVRAVLRGDAGKVRALTFAPDGRSLVTGSSRSVVLWGLPTAEDGESDHPPANARRGNGETPARREWRLAEQRLRGPAADTHSPVNTGPPPAPGEADRPYRSPLHR